MNVKSRKMDISGEIPASVPVTAAEIFIVVEMASAAAAGMGPCAARPVSKKSDVKEGSNAVKAALEETAAKEVFSIRREVSGKTVVKEGSNAVKAVLRETAAEEVFRGVKAGFVSRALEAGPPAVFPRKQGPLMNDLFRYEETLQMVAFCRIVGTVPRSASTSCFSEYFLSGACRGGKF